MMVQGKNGTKRQCLAIIFGLIASYIAKMGFPNSAKRMGMVLGD